MLSREVERKLQKTGMSSVNGEVRSASGGLSVSLAGQAHERTWRGAARTTPGNRNEGNWERTKSNHENLVLEDPHGGIACDSSSDDPDGLARAGSTGNVRDPNRPQDAGPDRGSTGDGRSDVSHGRDVRQQHL